MQHHNLKNAEIVHLKEKIFEIQLQLENKTPNQQNFAKTDKKLEKLKLDSKTKEEELKLKLDEIKTKISENEFEKEKMIQDFTTLVKILKTNQTNFEDFRELLNQKQQILLEKKMFLKDLEEKLSLNQTELEKSEKQIEKQIENKRSNQDDIIILQNQIKIVLKQKQDINVYESSFLKSKLDLKDQIELLNKEVCDQEQVKIQLTSQIDAFETEKDRFNKMAFEIERDEVECIDKTSKISTERENLMNKSKITNNQKFRINNTLNDLQKKLEITKLEFKKSQTDFAKNDAKLQQLSCNLIVNQRNLADSKHYFIQQIKTAEKVNESLRLIYNLQQETKQKLTENSFLNEIAEYQSEFDNICA